MNNERDNGNGWALLVIALIVGAMLVAAAIYWTAPQGRVMAPDRPVIVPVPIPGPPGAPGPAGPQGRPGDPGKPAPDSGW